MILSDRDIWRELKKKAKHRLRFIPPLSSDQVKTSTVDLRTGHRFIRLRFERPGTKSAAHVHIILRHLSDYTALEKDFGEEVIVEPGQTFPLGPGQSALAWTYEKIVIPPHLAGRVEGRSKFARIGLTVHNTAPTIHPGFGHSSMGEPLGSPICLELSNPTTDATFEITPPEDCLCQLILEKVSSIPKELYFRRGQFRPG